jgi:hypothetical protein
VPAAALRFTPPGEKEGATSGVWVLNGDRLERIEAHAGISDGEFTSVSEGPAAGTSVLVELTPAGRKAYGLAH